MSASITYTRSQIIDLLRIEKARWDQVPDDDPVMLQATIIAIGALSNVACAVGLGLTPEQFQAGLTTAFATGTGKADQP